MDSTPDSRVSWREVAITVTAPSAGQKLSSGSGIFVRRGFGDVVGNVQDGVVGMTRNRPWVLTEQAAPQSSATYSTAKNAAMPASTNIPDAGFVAYR